MINESGASPETCSTHRSPIDLEWCRRHTRRQDKFVYLSGCKVRYRARRGRFSVHDRGNIDSWTKELSGRVEFTQKNEVKLQTRPGVCGDQGVMFLPWTHHFYVVLFVYPCLFLIVPQCGVGGNSWCPPMFLPTTEVKFGWFQQIKIRRV